MKAGRVRIRGFHGADAAQPQLLHQPVLQRQMRALDAALGRTAVRAERVDVQLVHRAAKLRDAVAAVCRARLRNTLYLSL